MQASGTLFPAGYLREAYAKIRQLERSLGHKTMEVLLRATQEVVKKRRRCLEGPGIDEASLATICAVLGIASERGSPWARSSVGRAGEVLMIILAQSSAIALFIYTLF